MNKNEEKKLLKDIDNAVSINYNYGIYVGKMLLEKIQDLKIDKLIKNNAPSSLFIRKLNSVCKKIYSFKNKEEIKEIVDNILKEYNKIIYIDFAKKVLKKIDEKTDYDSINFYLNENDNYNLNVKIDDIKSFEKTYYEKDIVSDVSKMSLKIIKDINLYNINKINLNNKISL